MKIYAVLNQKCGVGKTALSTALAHALTKTKPPGRVLLVDLDPQGHASIVFGDQTSEYTTADLFRDPGFDIGEAIHPAVVAKTQIRGLDIVSSNIHLARTAEAAVILAHSERILSGHLEKIARAYDYVIIDSPPTLGILSVNAIAAATHLLIPATFQKFGIDGIADLLATVNEIREGEEVPYTIVKNAHDPRNTEMNALIENQLRPFSDNVARTIISKSEAVNQSQSAGESIFTFSPGSRAALDYLELAQELIHSRSGKF